jgi:hypothetical protein
MVSLSYMVPGHGSFHVTQCAAESDEFSRFGGERVERDGKELLVGEMGGQPQLLVEREGTRVFFTGQGIARDLLVEIALSLVPAPTEPPRLTG